MRPRGEAGTGVIATVFGVTAFLAFLMFAAQVLIGLYTRSLVSAATYDAARSVAGGGPAPVTENDAAANAQAQLGSYGKQVAFDWHPDDPRRDIEVHLTVTGPAPSLLPDSLLHMVGLGRIERSVTVRREKVS
ncbi:MAG TPA: hypothetical protein VFJ85_14580 [Acidimicrobiales bacterium]|nr:hypothetical protein [Acidimicrobiales bacterium]